MLRIWQYCFSNHCKTYFTSEHTVLITNNSRYEILITYYMIHFWLGKSLQTNYSRYNILFFLVHHIHASFLIGEFVTAVFNLNNVIVINVNDGNNANNFINVNACGGVTSNLTTVILLSPQRNSPSIVKLPTTYLGTMICTIRYKIWYCLCGKTLLLWCSPYRLVL